MRNIALFLALCATLLCASCAAEAGSSSTGGPNANSWQQPSADAGSSDSSNAQADAGSNNDTASVPPELPAPEGKYVTDDEDTKWTNMREITLKADPKVPGRMICFDANGENTGYVYQKDVVFNDPELDLYKGVWHGHKEK